VSALEQPQRLEAHEPPEVRGHGRDDVAMLVASRHDGTLVDARFCDLPQFLRAGDVLVVNTSATMPAALTGQAAGEWVEMRLSTPADAGMWIVELRTESGGRIHRPRVGTRVDLPAGAHADLVAPYAASDRLVVARLSIGLPLEEYLALHGRPIRYGYVPHPWPIEAYQTVFALEPGSAEMPSAGRPFTTELVTTLVASGVMVAPLQLHTGVSSAELGEPPYPERFRVPETTARLVNAAHAWGGRVIAVGTTAVRALETVAAENGTVAAGAGLTNLVVTPERGLRAVDGLLSGWHEPEASHLLMLEASAGPELLARSYDRARALGYRWHEFGDLHLVLP
jgi:S-adenosylmethionine:tRNA ribosyltransferase-isomerase